MSKLQNSYICRWHTISTKDGPARKGEIMVDAFNIANAIDVAKHEIAARTKLGLKEIVVYEVEEPFL